MQGPALVLDPSLAAKVRVIGFLIIRIMTHFCDEKSHLSTNITQIIYTFHTTSLHPCWDLAKKKDYEIFRAFIDFMVCKKAFYNEQHKCVWCYSLEKTEMQ
jgi:hypothetical protein